MIDMVHHLDFLRRVEFLAGVSEDILTRIGRELELLEVPEDTEIFPDGAPGDAMFFILDGDVRIVKHGQVLLTLHGGDYVGEFALIDDHPRSAAAVAATDVRLLRWRKENFVSTLRSDGAMAYHVCRALTRKVRNNVARVTRFRVDLERAAQVQSALLPETSFSNAAVELSAYCRQADNVGGDYYDYLTFGDDRLGLTVADVQGHGFYAALLVAMIKTRLHSRVATDPDPSYVMSALNQAILGYLNKILTATCCYALVDRGTRKLRFCSAGHGPQLHYRAAGNEIRRLESRNLLLGLPGQDDLEFTSSESDWGPGDLLLLFTDGLTEAANPHDEELGIERVQAVLREHRHEKPVEIRHRLIEALDRHRAGVPLADDVTIVVARLLS